MSLTQQKTTWHHICDPVSQTSRKVGKNDFEIHAKM